MTTATYSTVPATALRYHLHDVGTAARAFAETLFAALGRQSVGQEQRAPLAAMVQGPRQVLALAKRYDALAPSLSAQLRCIAAQR